jgi:hypothetical protein
LGNALASSIAKDMLDRAAETIVLTMDWLEEDGRELNQMQKVQLVETTLRCFDGVEAQVRSHLEPRLYVEEVEDNA